MSQAPLQAQQGPSNPWVWQRFAGEYCYYDEERQIWVSSSGRHIPRRHTQGVHGNHIAVDRSKPQATSSRAPAQLPIRPSAPRAKEPIGMRWEPYVGGGFQENQFLLIQSGQKMPLNVGSGVSHGRIASVSRVELDETNIVCALKEYSTGHSDPQTRNIFEQEINNMRKMKHRHVARFFAAYKREKPNKAIEYGILMRPWAELGTLDRLLRKCNMKLDEIDKEDRQVLMTSFGCLASVVNFLHSEEMRHKDLKPENVLIYEGRILLTDFGSSFDGSAAQSMTTHNENPSGYTDRYAAPEYKSGPSRNEKSDIFALGGIFYDIISTLDSKILSCDGPYRDNLKEVRERLLVGGDTEDINEGLKRSVYHMLSPNPDSRPSAKEVVGKLSGRYLCENCGGERPRDRVDEPPRSQGSKGHNNGRAGSHPVAGETTASQVSAAPSEHVSEEELNGILRTLRERATQYNLPPPAALTGKSRSAILRDRQVLHQYIGMVRQSWAPIVAQRAQVSESEDDEEDDTDDEEDE